MVNAMSTPNGVFLKINTLDGYFVRRRCGDEVEVVAVSGQAGRSGYFAQAFKSATGLQASSLKCFFIPEIVAIFTG